MLTWEEFLAYIRALPEGKAGWGFLRYDMLKEAQEQHLRVWFDKVMNPLLKGKWTPGEAVKKAEMMFLDKGKAGISTLDSFRGIGLLQHKYKLLEW